MAIKERWEMNKHAAVQALRAMLACAFAYVVTRALGLSQGYWAVFTVLIVMQASVGATLGAAVDRLLATVAGAVLGGVALLVTPHGPVALGVALIGVVGIASFAAAWIPRLRIAGLTAAIVMLTRAADVSVGAFVLNRILEITLGGVIGVLAGLLVVPTRSRTVLLERFAAVLDSMAQMLGTLANGVETGAAVSLADANMTLRRSLIAAEALIVEAQREQALFLSKEAVAAAIPRTLWRIRNDIAYLGGLLETPWPRTAGVALGPQAARALRAQAKFAVACGVAIGRGDTVERAGIVDAADGFAAAFSAFQHSAEARALGFEGVGRLFGFDFALRRLRQDFYDLAERIGERSAD